MSLLLNLIGACDKLFELVFWEIIISLACLVGSGLSCIFHQQNILHNEFIPGRSFMYIKSKSGLSTNLCRTLYIIFFHSYVWPFKTTVVKVVHLQHHKRLKWFHHAKHYQRLLTPLTSTVGFSSKSVQFYELLIIIGQYVNLLLESQIRKSIILEIVEKGIIYNSFKKFPENRK